VYDNLASSAHTIGVFSTGHGTVSLHCPTLITGQPACMDCGSIFPSGVMLQNSNPSPSRYGPVLHEERRAQLVLDSELVHLNVNPIR
jgi:hypothetical protein